MADPQLVDVDTEHDYDGIREFDNPLPQWWLATLWLAVVFTFFYWVWYHGIGAPGVLGEYERENAAYEKALIQSAVSEDELVAFAKDPAAVAAGREVFLKNCRSCHGESAEGQVGPNLTDRFWKNGGSPKQIYATVSLGVKTTAMAPWRPVLGDQRVREAVAYLLSVRNTDVPGPRGPEGKEEP